MPQVLRPRQPEAPKQPEVPRQPVAPRQPERPKPPEMPKPETVKRPDPPKPPAAPTNTQDGLLSRFGKHWKGMSIFARIMFVMGVYGTAVYGLGIVLGLMAGRGKTGNAGPVWISLAVFLLNVRNLFWLFHCEGVGYYGIYTKALSRKPDWVAYLAAKLLGVCYLMIYYTIAVASFVALDSVANMNNILAAIVVVGMLAFGAFNFIWPIWRCRTCNKIYWQPKKRKK